MSSHDLVSIIMPAYNAERYIAQSIESVLFQTHPDWELLIVNDASTDNTLKIAHSYQARDKRIRVFDMPGNSGVSAARNTALEQAGGKYIAFLDSDDLWLPEKLERQLAFMVSRGVSVSYSWYQRIDESGNTLGVVKPPPSVDYRAMLKSNFIGNLTGIYDAQVLGKEFFTHFRHEDYVAWLALLKRAGEAAGLQEPLAMYRVYAGSTSSNKLKVMGWQWRIYRESQAIGFLPSCVLMFHYLMHAINKRL